MMASAELWPYVALILLGFTLFYVGSSLTREAGQLITDYLTRGVALAQALLQDELSLAHLAQGRGVGGDHRHPGRPVAALPRLSAW